MSGPPQTSPQSQGDAYSHLPTSLSSSTHPILLRTLLPEDAPALAGLLSDPENMKFESDSPPAAMEEATAQRVIGAMRQSAGTPSVLGGGGGSRRVVSGPGRVNLAVVYLDGSEGRETGGGGGGRMIGLGGFGSIKDLEDAEGKKTRVGDVGVLLDSAHRGKGFAVEAIRLSMDWAFKSVEEGGLQLDKITSATLVENQPMVALLEKKMGWKGLRRPAPERAGKEEIFFEMTPEEWAARQ